MIFVGILELLKSYFITKHRLKIFGMTEKITWSHADLNRRPPACHAGALPAELWPQISKRQ